MELKRKHIYLLSFLLPLGVMIGVMICFGVQPFGDNSLLIIDGLHQYMPFFSVLYDKLKGAEGLFYTFRAGLGINFLSLFSYYLSSPLNLFILLFQKTQLNMAVSLLVVLKIALSGLTAGIYFTKKSKRPGIMTLVAAMAYALNSYMVGYCWNVMWLDAILILPIVLLGIEKLIEEGDGKVYCLALFYALYCNYYIAFMICIFSVIWYLFYSFSSVRQFLVRGLTFAFYSLLAAGMAAVLLIPAYLGIRQTASGESMHLPVHGWQTGIADLLTRQITLASPISHDNFDGNANLYIGIFSVIAVVLYLLNREICWMDKMKKVLLIAFFYLSFTEDILNFIWHGFHNQYGIPNRFSFLFGFVLLCMLTEVFEHWEGIRNWHAVLAAITGVVLLYVSRTWASAPLEDAEYGVIGMLFVFYGMILLMLSIDHRHYKVHLLLFGLTAMVEITATAVVGFEYNGQISVSKFFAGTEDMVEATAAMDDGTFYRSELAAAKMVDENAWHPLNAVGIFGSTAMDSTVQMMDSLGFYTGCNEYLYKGGNPVTNLMLGVRYLYYHPEDMLNTEFEYRDTFGDYAVYENPTKGLSIGYMMDDAIENWNYTSAYPFRVLNDFCYQGYSVDNVFALIDIADPVTEGCHVERTNDGEYHFYYEEAVSDHMIFAIPIEKTAERLYLFYDGTQVEQAQVSVDGDVILRDDMDGYILSVGRVEGGSQVTVQFTLKGETEDGYVRLSAAAFDPEMYQELENAMTSQAFHLTEQSSDHLEGTVTADQHQVLFFSIPFDTGWEVEVDGRPAETMTVGDAFLAVKLSEGEHRISLSYTPGGFSVGWKISLCSTGIFLCACGISVYRKRRGGNNGGVTGKQGKKEESA